MTAITFSHSFQNLGLWFIIFLVFVASGCKSHKDVSEMSDEEKIALDLDSSLSPEELNQQIAAREAILNRMNQTHNGEQAMARAMDAARGLISETQYKNLEKAQDIWLKQGRGKDIQKLIQSGQPAADAFGKSALDRADWITIRTSWAMLMETPGEFGGLYHCADGRIIELYEMPQNTLNLVIRTLDTPFVLTATGTYHDQSAQMHAEDNEAILIKIQKPREGEIVLLTTEAFGNTAFAQSRALAEGAFTRYQPGEWDVFSP